MLYAEFSPVKLESASGIIQIECGEDYSLALSQGGNVYSTGEGKSGIHGCGANPDDLANRYKFAPVGQSSQGFFKQHNIKYLSAGEAHAAVIDG